MLTKPPTVTARGRRGHTRWPRFSIIVLPALLVTVFAVASTASGAIPIELAAAQSHRLKLRIDSFTASSVVPSIGPYETRDGRRRTVLVFRLSDLTLRGVCLSNRVSTPIGRYTLRITVPAVTADRLTVAVDDISALDLLGQQLNIGPLLGLPIFDATPLSQSSEPGFLDVKIGNALAAVSLTIRYFTATGFNLHNVRLTSGRSQPECF